MNRPRSIFQNSNMAVDAFRTSFYIRCCVLCSQVSFEYWETKETWKISILTRKHRSHVRIFDISNMAYCSYLLTPFVRFVSLAIYYYRWSQDPFTQGSFSAPVVGFTFEDFNKLGENLERLYFGGEATGSEWYGYMQGAFLTGEEKAKLIACQILPDDSECKAPEKKKPTIEATFVAKSALEFWCFLFCVHFCGSKLYLIIFDQIWLSVWRHHLANLHILKTWISLEQK